MAGQSVDFVAEHLLEVPMDMRYGVFAHAPQDLLEPQWRVQFGLGRVSGANLRNTVPMLGLSRYIPASPRGGWLFAGFFDRYRFSGDAGPASMAPSFGNAPSLPGAFDVQIRAVDGSADHVGLSLARVHRLDSGGTLQFGLAVERLDVARFRAAFRTTGLAQDFDGAVDYAGVYDIFTPFVSAESSPRSLSQDWQGHWLVRLAWPLPRVGFKGRLTGPGFDVSGDTTDVGGGKHIPDPFVGLGYTLEHRPSGLQIDIGATLYGLVLEPRVHREIGRALMLSFSLPF
ncbi:MAG: hypothetical protein R3E87_04630 [Burkholderiaceae bacterium]